MFEIDTFSLKRLKNESLSIDNGIEVLSSCNQINKSKLMHFVLLVVPGVIALLLNTNLYAQEKDGEIDKIFSWATPTTPGCICAVSQNGKVLLNRAYGSADLERDVLLNANSVFDVGSLVKQFVAAATLILVEEGRLSLSDDVRKYIPELPNYSHKITIDHLLTHTSGLRDWTGILPLTANKEEALKLILRQRSLNFIPGDEWAYSNSGFVLLKEIIARISGTSFGEFTQERLFEPLGMKATTYRHDLREVVKNRAMAYKKVNRQWKMAMLLENDRGGGGALFSTASDLLIWNDALTNKRLGKFVTEKLEESAKLNNGRKIKYARGLFVETYRNYKEIWHSGGAAGYHSWLGRYPELNLSAVVLCNSDEATASASAARIIDQFLPASNNHSIGNNLPPVAAEGVDTSTLDLKNKTGLFFSTETNEPLRLVVDRGRLRVANGPALVAHSKNHFQRWGAAVEYRSGDEFKLLFLSPEEVELRSMEGKAIRYRRAQPYITDANHLKAFAGRFESDEIGAIFLIEPKREGLVLRLEHSPEKSLELKQMATDVFQFARMLVRFQRDKAGKVVALDYSNPVIRNVTFKRLSN